jgi:GGDEF domain-containing protein
MLTLVLVDLDGPQGDGVRRTVAAVLQRWTRSIDGVYRVGQDRFVLILPGADGQAGRALTERIAERLGDAHPLAASARFGVAQAGDEDPALLYAAAEAELLRPQRADAA